ncbi:hypothetical protein YN1_2250 [Nanoarchaeota archaeon]
MFIPIIISSLVSFRIYDIQVAVNINGYVISKPYNIYSIFYYQIERINKNNEIKSSNIFSEILNYILSFS